MKAVVQYLQRRLPALADPSQGPLKEKHFAKSTMLSTETLPVILVCLQQASQQLGVHPEIKEAVGTMIAQAQPLLARPRPGGAAAANPLPPPGAGAGSAPPPPARPAVTGAGAAVGPTGLVSLPGIGGAAVRPTPTRSQPPMAPPPPNLANLAQAAAAGLLPPSAATDPLMSQFGSLSLAPTSAAGGGPPPPPASSNSSAFSLPALGPLLSSGAGSPNR